MDEYTYDNIIIDPTKEGIESLIRKEVYFHNNPSLCLAGANEKSTVSLGVLVEIHKDSITPFVVERNDTDLAYSCIIEKKKEEPKYVPFESKEEFIDAFHYHDNANYSETDDILLNYGMWLKIDNEYRLVIRISDDGIAVAGYTINWSPLMSSCTFFDNTPCGKEVKDV